jgi:hypothetical protein
MNNNRVIDDIDSPENLWHNFTSSFAFDDLIPLDENNTIKGVLCPKPDIPVEMEPYFKFLLKAIELAKFEIEHAKVGSEHYESAVAWLVYGEGYDYLAAILADPERIKALLESIIDRRRGAFGSEGRDDRLAVVQLPRIRRQSSTERKRITRNVGVPSSLE